MLRLAVVCAFSAVSLALSGAKSDRHELTPHAQQQIKAAEIVVEGAVNERAAWKKAASENPDYILLLEIGAV